MDRLPSWRPPHGLRAKEISDIRWSMVNDAEGAVTDTIHLVNGASKGKRGGREIPMAKDLWQALVELQAFKPAAPEDRIIFSERDIGISPKVLAIWFLTLYRDLGFKGVSSHSGRRTFVTKAAKRCIEGGGSLRDVQQLAGHSSLATTQRYIEGSSDAPHRRSDLVMRRLSIQNDPAAVEASPATWDERRARRDKEQTCSVVDTLGGCQYDPLRTSGKRRHIKFLYANSHDRVIGSGAKGACKSEGTLVVDNLLRRATRFDDIEHNPRNTSVLVESKSACCAWR